MGNEAAGFMQIDIFCMLIAVILFVRIRVMDKSRDVAARMKASFGILILLSCASDLLMRLCETGHGFPLLLQMTFILYVSAESLLCCGWLFYVLYESGMLTAGDGKKLFFYGLPQLLLVLMVSMNLIRGGILHPLLLLIIPLVYFLSALAVSLHVVKKEESKVRREELGRLVQLSVFLVVVLLLQKCFNAYCILQAGAVIAYGLLYDSDQRRLSQRDGLTGLNNRRSFDLYVEGILRRGTDVHMTVIMTDVNAFKSINDTYGHMTGDKVLTEISQEIKRACSLCETRAFLCRYGGDEFLITAAGMRQGEAEKLVRVLSEGLAGKKDILPDGKTVSISCGIARGICSSRCDYEALIAEADEVMYDEKQERKQVQSAACLIEG